VNMPRKFEANIAIVFKKAPRFSSTPVWSTRAGASDAGGGTSSKASVALTDSWWSGSEVWAISVLCVMRKSVVIHFRRNMLDLAGRKTNIRAIMIPTLQSSPWGRQNFLAQPFGHASVNGSSLYCIERRLSYTPFRQTA
jgi:hypothetical protein